MILFVLFLVALGGAGCASNRMTRSGFLADYDSLQPSSLKNVMLYRAPDFDPARYSAMVIELPRYANASERLRALTEDERRELLDFLGAELARRFKDIWSPDPVPGAVRVRLAVTDIDSPNVVVNMLTTLALGPVTTGGASIELELIDDGRAQRLMAYTCYETANVITGMLQAFSTLGHARSAISACIARFESAYRAK